MIWVGVVDAALGLRAAPVFLTNCGRRSVSIRGYPRIGVLDDERRPLGLTVARGVVSGGIPDPGPRTLRLRPGDSAVATMSWRLLVEASDTPALTGEHIQVSTLPGQPPQTAPLHLDAGTTRNVRVTAWRAAALGGAPSDAATP